MELILIHVSLVELVLFPGEIEGVDEEEFDSDPFAVYSVPL